MKNFLIVSVLNGEANLCKPVEHVIFAKILSLSLSVLHFCLLFNFGLKVSVIAVVHHDTQLPALGFVDFAEPRNVGVVEHFEDLCLFKSFFALVLGHLANVDLLDDCHLLVRLALYEVRRSEGPHAKNRHLFVGFVAFTSLFVDHFIFV